MKSKQHITAIAQAVFVTFLWSTSWVLIKFGLRNQLPALTFAGLRYFTAFLCLVPFVAFNKPERERIRNLSRADWLWLAVVNTAFAFTLWNHTLRTLSAIESSVLNSLMMPQIALLAYLFLGETLSPREVIGLLLVGIGVAVAQQRARSERGV